MEKGDFIGRDAMLRQGTARERFGTFTVEAGDSAIWGDEAIFRDGEPVGYVTSGGWGPVTEQHIALGYVQADAWKQGAEYAVEILGKLCPAILHAEPLYDPKGNRMRA